MKATVTQYKDNQNDNYALVRFEDGDLYLFSITYNGLREIEELEELEEWANQESINVGDCEDIRDIVSRAVENGRWFD